MSNDLVIPEYTKLAQRRAANPRASAWVSANAGAGKTKVLTDRVVRLLLSGSLPGRILCLTFTKAAAANMANRVFQELRAWTLLDDDALDEAIAFVEARERPLALYPFGTRTQAETILARIVPGGVTVNDTLLHFAANRLPFGGVGPSGMGAYHGRAGFDAMTKALPVLWQSRIAVTDWLRPPYARIAKLVDFLAR